MTYLDRSCHQKCRFASFVKKNYVADFEAGPRHGYATGLLILILIVTYLATAEKASLFLPWRHHRLDTTIIWKIQVCP